MSSSPADFTALILSDPHPSLQPRACLVGWETDHTLLLLVSFRNCKMGFIIVFISQGSLSILDQHLSLRKHCISVKTGIKSSTHAHLWSSCFVPSTGLAVSLQRVRQVSCPSGAMCLLGQVLPSSPHTAASPLGDSCSLTHAAHPHRPCGTTGPSPPLSTDNSILIASCVSDGARPQSTPSWWVASPSFQWLRPKPSGSFYKNYLFMCLFMY